MSQFSLSGLRFKRPLTAGALLLATSMAGCGSPPAVHHNETSSLNDVSTGLPAASQSFGLWCQDWQLACTQTIPTATEAVAVDPGVRKAFSTIFLELLQSSSQLTLTRADLDAGELKKGLKGLSLDTFLSALGERLDTVGWKKATLANSMLSLESTQSGWLPTRGGLDLGLSPDSSFRFLPGDRLEVKGISLKAGAAGQTSSIQAIQFLSSDMLTLELSDRKVENVPNWFLAQILFEAFGANDPRLEPKPQVSRTESILSLYPLLNWLNQPTRVISLSRRFFTKTADELATLPSTDPAVLAVVGSLDSLQTTQVSGKNSVSLTQVAGSALRCDANQGDLVLSFDPSFGIKRFYPADKGGIGFEFYGVKASSKKTLGSFPVKRLEFTPEAYNILDVPLLNKISLKWDDLEKEASKGTVVKTVCTL